MDKEQKKQLITRLVDADFSLAQIEEYISSGSTLDPEDWLRHTQKDQEFEEFLDEQFEDHSGDLDEIHKKMGTHYK